MEEYFSIAEVQVTFLKIAILFMRIFRIMNSSKEADRSCAKNKK
jgi:hypothetical protein